MKFKFNLERVLDHRRVIEDLAQVDFQSAVYDLTQAEGILQKMRQEIVNSRKSAFEVQVSGRESAPARLQQVELFIKGQLLRIKSQEAKIQNLQNIVESKREILRSRATERKILERLKANKQAEFNLEASRQEQIEADEMNLMRLRLKEKE